MTQKQGSALDRLMWRLVGTPKAKKALGIDEPVRTGMFGAMKSLSEWVQGNRITSISKYDRAALYATSVTVYAAANYRARNVSLVPLLVRDKNGDVINDKALGSYQPDHPLTHIFRPNGPMTRIMRRNEYAYCFYGYWINYKLRNGASVPIGLQWVNPYNVTVDADTWRGLRGFYLTGSDAELRDVVDGTYIYPRDTVYVYGMDFRDDYDGVAPAEVAFTYSEADAEIAQTYAAVFRNMAIPAMYGQPTQDVYEQYRGITKEQSEGIMNSLRRIAQGSINAGRNVLIPFTRVEWERMQPALKDLDLGTVGEQVERSISKAFDMPVDLLTMNASNYAQAAEARRSWAENWLVPQVAFYAHGYTEQLAEAFGDGYTVEPDISNIPALRENEESKVQVLGAKLTSGAITYGQYNSELGDDPVPELENMVYVPAIQAPVPLAEVPTLWERLLPQAPQDGNPLAGLFGPPPSATASADKPAPAKSTTADDIWIDDDQYRELKALIKTTKKRGADYDFKTDVLPAHVVSYVQNRVTAGHDTEDIVSAARGMLANATKARPIDEALFFETVNLWDELGLTDLVRPVRELDNESRSTDFVDG